MLRRIWFGALVCMLFIGASSARVQAEPPETKWFDKFQVSGFVDAYYQFNFNGLSGGTSGNINSPVSIVQRAFDVRQNEFSFSSAKLGISASDVATGTGAELDLLFGPTSTIAVGNVVEQAFATFALGPVGVKLGKMATHLGFEVIDTPANWNYSRSILFTMVPYYHVGLMANYSPLAGLGIMAGLANGNSTELANDEAKDIMAQISYSSVPGLNLYGNYYLEANRTTAGLQPFENTHYLELTGTYQAAGNLGLGLDYLYKTTIASADKDAAGDAVGDAIVDAASGRLLPFSPKSQGYALYANYATPVAGLSIVPRFEQWYAPDNPGFAMDYTLTAKYACGPLVHYLELRSDIESPAGFQPSGAMATSTEEYKSNQVTVTYGATYSF